MYFIILYSIKLKSFTMDSEGSNCSMTPLRTINYPNLSYNLDTIRVQNAQIEIAGKELTKSGQYDAVVECMSIATNRISYLNCATISCRVREFEASLKVDMNAYVTMRSEF